MAEILCFLLIAYAILILIRIIMSWFPIDPNGWALDPAEETIPEVLEVTARSEDGVVQAVRHRNLPIEGVQFHPESIMTTVGRELLGNFLESPVASLKDS
jgi:hypothetical protein